MSKKSLPISNSTRDGNLIKLYEGLIYTHELNRSVSLLNKWITGESNYVDTTPDGEIQLNFYFNDLVEKQNKGVKIISAILGLANNIGWFPARIYYGVESISITKKLRYSQENINRLFDKPQYKAIRITLQAKFDVELSVVPDKLYHITPKVYLSKILQQGLVPKSKQKLSAHPDRVHFTLSKESAIELQKQLVLSQEHEEYVLLEIDTTKVPELRLFDDPDFKSEGVYTLQNIPPQAITVIAEIN